MSIEKIAQEWKNLIGQEVTFRKPIFEDDWQVDGSKGVVKAVRFHREMVCVHFDFSSFEPHNFPLMEKVYYTGNSGELGTAVETGHYKPVDYSYTEFPPSEYIYPHDQEDALKTKAKELFPNASAEEISNMIFFAQAAKSIL